MNTALSPSDNSQAKERGRTNIKGAVKWFSRDKGYGFISSVGGAQYYFNGHDVRGADILRGGDLVSFTLRQSKKGQSATDVHLEAVPVQMAAVPDIPSTDSRVLCQGCHKLMVPRLVMGPPLGATTQWTPVPKRSVCPFCAATHREFPPSDRERFILALQWTASLLFLCVFAGMFLKFLRF